MKRLILTVAALILGVCFAGEGYCFFGLGRIRQRVVETVEEALEQARTFSDADPCAWVRNRLDDFGTCPAGESCVNVSARLVRVDRSNTNCRLSMESTSWNTNHRSERFVGVENGGGTTVLAHVTSDYDLNFIYQIDDVSEFTSYDYYEIRYRNSILSFSDSEKRIAFTSIEYTPPAASAVDEGTDTGGEAGGGDGRDVEGPAGGGGEGEVTDPCASVTCLEGQTCDPVAGACVVVDVLLPTDLCAGVSCPAGKMCMASTGACVAGPPPVDLCSSITCPSGQACADGACTTQIDLPRKEEGRNPDEPRTGLDTSEGGCQLFPNAALSGAPYLWLILAGIALAIARRRLK